MSGDKNLCFHSDTSYGSGGLDDAIIESGRCSEDMQSKARLALKFFDNRDLQDNIFYKAAEEDGRARVVHNEELPATDPVLPIGKQEHLSQYDQRGSKKRGQDRDHKRDENIKGKKDWRCLG